MIRDIAASASVCIEYDDPGEAHERIEKALRLLDGADGLRVERAELHLSAAALLHEHWRIVAARAELVQFQKLPCEKTSATHQ